MEQEDRSIVKESVLDEDNRFSPLQGATGLIPGRVDGGCSSCGRMRYGGNIPNKKDYDLTVVELLELRKEVSVLKDAVRHYNKWYDFYRERYHILKKLDGSELILREFNKQ